MAHLRLQDILKRSTPIFNAGELADRRTVVRDSADRVNIASGFLLDYTVIHGGYFEVLATAMAQTAQTANVRVTLGILNEAGVLIWADRRAVRDAGDVTVQELRRYVKQDHRIVFEQTDAIALGQTVHFHWTLEEIFFGATAFQ